MKTSEIRTFSISALALVAMCCSTLLAGPAMPSLSRLEEANSLKDSFQTPHTKWAKPYANGPIRVLFITPLSAEVNVLPLRGPVEIIQRFDIEADAVLVLPAKGTSYAVAYAGGSGLYGAQLGDERLARLLKNKYDCYVVTAGSALGNIPPEARKIILRRVNQEGAGLVFLYKLGEGDKSIMAGTRELKLPETLKGLDAKTYQLAKGRLVSHVSSNWNVYNRRPPDVYALAHIFGTDLPRDLRFEKQGRVILWAARREPKLKLSISLSSEAIARSDLSKHPITVKWAGRGLVGPLRMTGRIRSQSRGSGHLLDLAKLNPALGKRTFRIPRLPAGKYWVDVIARSDRGIEAWAIKMFKVTTAETVSNVKIDRYWGEPGESIKGSLEVKTPNRLKRTLRVHAVDRYGRVLARQEFPNPAQNVKFSLPTDSRMPGYLGVEAALVANGEEITHGYGQWSYTIPQHKQDQWNVLLWGRLYSSTFDDIAEELIAASGITSRIETSHSPFWFMTRAGMNYTPYCASGLYRLPDSGPQEPSVGRDGVLDGNGGDGCWNDEPRASALIKEHLDDEMDYRKHGVLAYSMGDEMGLFGSCLHKSCWKVYQNWLKNEYGTIRALNESWGTSYRTFGQIEPLIDNTELHWLSAEDKGNLPLVYANNEHSSRGQTHGSTAWNKKWKNYPRYIDRRSFQYWNFANYARRFGDTARKMDPHARAGMEGNDIRLDADIDVIVRNTGWWMPYGEHGGTTNEVIRSIAPKGYLYGNFFGSRYFWESFLRGANTVGKFRIDNILTPQMALKDSVRRIVDSGRIVFDGLGTLLNVEPRAEMLHDGIVMLHSMTSIELAKITTSHDKKEPGPTYGDFRTRDHNGKSLPMEDRKRRNHTAWHGNIRACGLQFEYTTDGQIKRGEFDPSPYKVMILAQYEAIGPEEEKAIRDFVTNGGTLIADVRPGIYGARGKKRKNGSVLDDLFGVRQDGNAPARKTNGIIAGQIDDTKLAVRLPNLYVNPAVSVTRGKALGRAGNTPICIVNKVGKGRAILLNFTMWSYPNLALYGIPDEAADVLRNIFSVSGVEWPLALVDEEGKRHRNIEAMRWQTGRGIEVVALNGPTRNTWPEFPAVSAPFKGLDTAVPVTVHLPRQMYAYEMRTGRRSDGPTNKFVTGVRPWWATLLVLSERELRPPALTMVKDIATRGEVFRLEVTIADAQGMNALKLRGTGPDGRDAPWYSRSVIVKDGAATIELPIAYNERPGTWVVTVTDLYTDESATASFRVE